MAGQALPTGTVTFLFTDIEGSTELLQELGDAYADELLAHHRILRDAITASSGVEVGTEGDAFFVAFERPADALACALRAQLALGSHAWNGRPIRVRMGMHTGDVKVVADDYVGLSVHVAARVASAAHGGQVLISRTTRDIVGEQMPEGAAAVALGPHRLKDLREPTELFQLTHAKLADTFPPLRTLSVLPNNLPAQLTTLVGRERELEEVRALVGAHRILTLTGAGGVGKTRLAVQVAAELASEFPDGVWFIDLSIVRDPAYVGSAFAAPLAVTEQPDRALIGSVADALRARTSLIVVDNCEHLVQPVADAVQSLVLACPDLRIVATSREPLGIAGEAIWRVPSLGVPDDDAGPDALSSSECVRLFVDRAMLADRSVSISHDDLRAAGHICRRLDGIPLAIELAAGRVGVLSCTQIADRLDDRFRLLTGGSRTVLGRQQTLRALIDWSHDLLDDAERILLRRLSVFVGSFSLEGAEAVCSDDHLDALDVLEALAGLVRKSLVVTRPDERYALLETVRQYAYEKLIDAGEAAAVRTSHRDWCRSFVEVPEVRQTGPAHIAWLDRVDAEYDNVRAALEWSIGERDAEPAMLMAGSLRRYWFTRGSWTEGRAWLARVLALNSEPTRARAYALLEAGVAGVSQDFYSSDETLALFDESLAIWRELDDRAFLAETLCASGDAIKRQNPRGYGRARAYLEESLAIYRDLGDDNAATVPLTGLAEIADAEGRTQEARRIFEELIDTLRASGSDRELRQILYALGMTEANLGRFEAAHALFEEVIAINRSLGDVFRVADHTAFLMEVKANLGQMDDARRLLDEIEECIDRSDDPFTKAKLNFDAALGAWRIDGARARALMEEGLRSMREIELTYRASPIAIASMLRCVGVFSLALGDDARAREIWPEVLARTRALPLDVAATGDLFVTANFAYELGEIATAEELFRETLSSMHETGRPGYVAMSLDGLAMVAASHGRWPYAVSLFGASDVIHEQIGFPHPDADFHSEGLIPGQRRAEYERLVGEAKEVLGPRAFAEAWDAGRAMTIDEAVAYALADDAAVN